MKITGKNEEIIFSLINPNWCKQNKAPQITSTKHRYIVVVIISGLKSKVFKNVAVLLGVGFLFLDSVKLL